MNPSHAEPLVALYHGDCVAVMAALDEVSIDAIVTDPPYGLEFMGKDWDRLEGSSLKAQQWHEAWARAAFRVLKPGGHLLAFGGSRTCHRLACAIEDAGFEVRDCLMWLYGSGFPKSLDVSKAIDKAVLEAGPPVKRMIPGADQNKVGWEKNNGREFVPTVTTPATDAAREWSGWGTALKPAHEPIVLARKPLAEKNVAANVLAHGTGAINVDGCRIGGPDGHGGGQKSSGGFAGGGYEAGSGFTTLGRWPANVLLSHAEGCEMVGTKRVKGKEPYVQPRPTTDEAGASWQKGEHVPFHYGEPETVEDWRCVPDCPVRLLDEQSGGASRFFYTAKADKKDRDGSKHPTVKPVDLMKWLVRLVTPPDGVVLDPFVGSGTTVFAARALGLRSIGIEQDAAYIADAIHRLRQGVLL